MIVVQTPDKAVNKIIEKNDPAMDFGMCQLLLVKVAPKIEEIRMRTGKMV